MTTILIFALCAPMLPQDMGGPWEDHLTLNASTLAHEFGDTATAVPDLDGDGRMDFLVGATLEAPAGAAYLFSSVDGSLIRRHASTGIDEHFGAAVAAVGDLDLDGIGDYAIGASWADAAGVNNAGSLFVYSGADGSLLRQYHGTGVSEYFGHAVTPLGDVDGDGRPDLAVGAYGRGPGGAVHVCSGAADAVLYRIDAPTDGDWFGHAVAAIDDLDGDGVGELVVGSPTADVGGIDRNGFVEVYSGADGSFLRRHVGDGSLAYFGWDVATIADLDGDGSSEYMIGARRRSAAYLHSGATGDRIHEFIGPDAAFFGDVVGDAGDVDGDGFTDLLVTALDKEAWVLSGPTGAILSRRTVEAGFENFAAAWCGVGDQDGDGRADLLLTDRDILGPGRARILSGFLPEFTATAHEISLAAGGTIDFDIDFPASEAGLPYRIVASSEWGILQVRGRVLAIADAPPLRDILATGYIPGMTGQSGILDPQGDAAASVTLPPGSSSSFVGMTLYGIAVVTQIPRVPGRASSAVGVKILP